MMMTPVPGARILGLADGLSRLVSRLSEIGVVAMMVLLTYEVITRYVFRAPTHWTSDVATTTMIWLTFLAMGYCLREGHMIRITAIIGQLSPSGRKIAEGVSLIAILLFSIFAVWISTRGIIDSISMSRRQPTMLQMPTWIGELPIVLGFAILALQAAADLLRLPYRPAPDLMGVNEPELPAENRRDPQ